MTNSVNIEASIPRDYVTVPEAAMRCAVNVHAVWDMLRTGTLTRHRRPRDKKTYISVADLERVMTPKPAKAKETPFAGRHKAPPVERF